MEEALALALIFGKDGWLS